MIVTHKKACDCAPAKSRALNVKVNGVTVIVCEKCEKPYEITLIEIVLD